MLSLFIAIAIISVPLLMVLCWYRLMRVTGKQLAAQNEVTAKLLNEWYAGATARKVP